MQQDNPQTVKIKNYKLYACAMEIMIAGQSLIAQVKNLLFKERHTL